MTDMQQERRKRQARQPLPFLLLPLIVSLLAPPARAQTGAITGRVTDSTAQAPVGGARVQATSAGRPAARTLTGPDGAFRLERLAPGTYSLSVTRIGYDPAAVPSVTVRAGETATVAVSLTPRAISLDAEVVTASRQEEKVLEAPASVSVLAREDIAAHPSLTPADRVAQLPGVDVVTGGLTQHNVVTRGFNNAGSGQLLVLTDNRYAAVPSLRINAYNFIPLTDDDLDRIEVVRGPGAALYGPNATAGVMHLISRSPFDSRGTSLSLSGGERGLLQVTGRHAGVVGSRLGWKLSGQYFRAQDFGYLDPQEAKNRSDALLAGADPDTLRVGRRDSLIERASGEARVDWRAGAQTTLIGAVGVNQAINNVDITGFGAAQVRDWRYQYAQVRLLRPDLFAQMFYNGSDAGETYLLETGLPVADRSQLFAAQFQHVLRLGQAETITWGADGQRTVPRTGGTIYGRFESDDNTNEAGAYVHSETRLPLADLVGALRLDYHSRVPGVVLSPRGAVVLHPGAGHTLRFTYNRAFSTPSSYDLFLDLLVRRLSVGGLTLPYAIRAMGVPSSGFTFRRDCGTLLGGLCMRSPYAPGSLGGPTQYLPADATQLWSVVVDSVKSLIGVDLSGVPAPSSAQVASRLARGDIASGALAPISPDEVTDLGPLGDRTTNTLELGYKGLLSDRLLATVDLYYSWYRGFSSTYVVTPSVLFDPVTLQAYLRQYLPATQADSLAQLISQLPVGTVSPEQAFDPSDILAVTRYYGRVSVGGVDAAATWRASRLVTVMGTYSWVSGNQFAIGTGVGDTVALNAPRHKASLSAAYGEEREGVTARATARYVGGFPVISNVYHGVVHPYATLDADLAVPLPFAHGTRLSLSGQNLLQATTDAFGEGFQLRSSHREFVGVPAMRRLLLARLQVEW